MHVLALADKLMEETEELCLQREQREVSPCVAVQKDSGLPPDTAGIRGSVCMLGEGALSIQKLSQETSEGMEQ